MFKEYTLSWVKNEAKVGKTSGKPYTSLAVKVEGDESFYNGFGNTTTETWQKGDTVKLRLFEEEYNGKMYKKVETPNRSALQEERTVSLENRVTLLENWVKSQGTTLIKPSKEDTLKAMKEASTAKVFEPPEEVLIDDLPF